MLTTSSILLVEDENNLGITLQEYLENIGYQCLWANSAAKAKEFFINHRPHPRIVLMDIGLPDGDGISLAKEFRRIRDDFVLLFLSAQNDPQTRLQGFELGGHDYITKPFALKELTLRLERILRPQDSFNKNFDIVENGPLKIWFKKYEVQDAYGNIINLSQKECAILKLLYQKINQVVARDHIIDKIWGENVYPSNRTVDNYIVKLRKWMATDTEGHLDIISIRGIGYKLISSAPNNPLEKNTLLKKEVQNGFIY